MYCIHSYRLQVTHMQGHNGEYIAFRTPLATHSDATTWMRLFEEKMQQSIGLALQDLIHLRLKGYCILYDSLKVQWNV